MPPRTDGAADAKREGGPVKVFSSPPVDGELNVRAVPLLTLAAEYMEVAIVSAVRCSAVKHERLKRQQQRSKMLRLITCRRQAWAVVVE